MTAQKKHQPLSCYGFTFDTDYKWSSNFLPLLVYDGEKQKEKLYFHQIPIRRSKVLLAFLLLFICFLWEKFKLAFVERRLRQSLSIQGLVTLHLSTGTLLSLLKCRVFFASDPFGMIWRSDHVTLIHNDGLIRTQQGKLSQRPRKLLSLHHLIYDWIQFSGSFVSDYLNQ